MRVRFLMIDGKKKMNKKCYEKCLSESYQEIKQAMQEMQEMLIMTNDHWSRHFKGVWFAFYVCRLVSNLSGTRQRLVPTGIMNAATL